MSVLLPCIPSFSRIDLDPDPVQRRTRTMPGNEEDGTHCYGGEIDWTNRRVAFFFFLLFLFAFFTTEDYY